MNDDETKAKPIPVRCKLMLKSIYHAGPEARTVTFEAQYDESIEEDRRFSKYTPSGEFKMLISNPSVIARLELGKTYYFDMIEA
jgi:hypothetical protein